MTDHNPNANTPRSLIEQRPLNDDVLHQWIKDMLGFEIPRTPLVTGHDAPFDYIRHAFFEEIHPEVRDCVVWANRGGGKTQLGAIATLLDMLFKPGIQVRILGGSLEQSSKMYRYLRTMIEVESLSMYIEGRLTGKALQLVNGSRVEVLSQSERAVRGTRIHRLRCDEVELFETEVWEAAQLVTRSGQCGEIFVQASIESLSTMHRPYGLMQKLVKKAAKQRRTVFRWSVLDTLVRCEPRRSCDTCALWDDCRGLAKEADGFVHIDDAIRQRHRVGLPIWRSEMLCDEPNRSDTVYPEFDVKVHVESFEPDEGAVWLGGIDFGYRAPTALLWAFLDGEGVLRIIDEYAQRERTAEQVIEVVRGRSWPGFNWIGADPAGYQRSDQTGVSTISIWKKAGFTMKARASRIEDGVNGVRARLRKADGSVWMKVHPRCVKLIESLTMYHYPSDQPESLVPIKDGQDHIADALRYLVVNLDREGWGVKVRKY
ncbi:MAG: hypothetical protein O7G85_01755 [Planctomycetota bacterium]|nr:hypothetical protein [Planctomycetota bacterium]